MLALGFVAAWPGPAPAQQSDPSGCGRPASDAGWARRRSIPSCASAGLPIRSIGFIRGFRPSGLGAAPLATRSRRSASPERAGSRCPRRAGSDSRAPGRSPWSGTRSTGVIGSSTRPSAPPLSSASSSGSAQVLRRRGDERCRRAGGAGSGEPTAPGTLPTRDGGLVGREPGRGSVLWLGLASYGEGSISGGGVARYDIRSGRLLHYDLPGVVTGILPAGSAVFFAGERGLHVLRRGAAGGDVLDRLTVRLDRDGAPHVLRIRTPVRLHAPARPE